MEGINANLVCASEYIKNRLYFATLRTGGFQPKNTSNTHYFSIDDVLVYENFYADFGPLNLALLHRYCQLVNEKLKLSQLAKKRIIHITTMDCNKRANAAFLIASYAIIYLNKTPEQAYWPLVGNSHPPFVPFRDASLGTVHYSISLMDVLNALYKALNAGFFNFQDFDRDEYEHYERVENGDLNWIIPQKFIAFCGPHAKSKLELGYPLHSPESYFHYFRKNKVTSVVRLNKKIYDGGRFTAGGFSHHDLFFVDGSTPSDQILDDFLNIAEGTDGALAVHCKAGLGRTGSLIGCYLMKHYRFSAMETIAWIRLCRPGSIIGHQQDWLLAKQTRMWFLGDQLRQEQEYEPPTHYYGIYSRQLKAESGMLDDRDRKAQDVSRILQRVDTMRLEDQEDENKNKEDSKNGNGIILEAEPRRHTITQGDKLNQIKALRRHPRSLTTTGTIHSVESRPHTRAKSQPLVTGGQAQQPAAASPAAVLSPLKTTKVTVTLGGKAEREPTLTTAKRPARSTTAATKRNSWLLGSVNGTNRSLNINKVTLSHPSRQRIGTLSGGKVHVLPTSPIPAIPANPGTGMTLRSADRASKYHSIHRHARTTSSRTVYKSTLIR